MPHTDLVGEQGADVAEELQLLLQGVTALLRRVHDEQNRSSQVSQSCDGLHLDGVPLLQRVVQDTGGVHHLHRRAHSLSLVFVLTMQRVSLVCVRERTPPADLPAEVSVVHVTHEQRLGGESVRLDVNICSGHLMRKITLA